MARVGPHMSGMEAIEARGGGTPEVITFITNKRLASATGMVKEVVIAPIAVKRWAVISIIITVVVHWPVCGGARCQCEQRSSPQNRFQFLAHDNVLVPALPGT